MIRTAIVSASVLLITSFAAPVSAADNWVEWKSDEFGFRMLIPPKMKMSAASLGEWGGIHGELPPVHLYGVAHLKDFPELPAMQAFAIKHIGIPAAKWALIDQSEGKHGWKWQKTYRAVDKGRFAYAILGHGPKGAYILYLSTTPANRVLFNAAYIKWYQSVTLY